MEFSEIMILGRVMAATLPDFCGFIHILLKVEPKHYQNKFYGAIKMLRD